jgi:hypothetical protein
MLLVLLIAMRRNDGCIWMNGPVVLLALPFRYATLRYEINSPAGYTRPEPGRPITGTI